jgi:murein DD-endopeptidase MepM/ murein hydrolase activator NlpD
VNGPFSRSSFNNIVFLLALIGLAWLAFQLFGPARERQLSLWTPAGQRSTSANAAAAAPNNGLSGVAVPLQGRGLSNDLRPQGNPLGVPNTVMTQGYGVGSHAPAETWGAIDLAIDSDNDGGADPAGTWEHPVYATHDGVVRVTPDSWPAGNHVWVTNNAYRTGYSHLARFAVSSGQQVKRGDLIGYIGSTGQSSGPHLDYQVWEMVNGNWVNFNPLDYGALDGT